jgi:hypothetical protein
LWRGWLVVGFMRHREPTGNREKHGGASVVFTNY